VGHTKTMRIRLAALSALLAACGAAAPAAPPSRIAVSTQIVTPSRDTTEPELFARAERELRDEEWRPAQRDFELLLKAGPSPAIFPTVLFDLGTADEALSDREGAAGAYHALADKFPALPAARIALVRCVWLHTFLEQWERLGDTGEALLARPDLDALDRTAALGARALSRAELGKTDLAVRDVETGLDIVEDHHFGMNGRLPPAGAELKLALGEARRIETERVKLQPVTQDFVAKVSARCQGLLDAQRAYADAMRTTDPQLATMAGYRLGAMYQKLHDDLMSIPSDGFAKTEHQRQVFYGIMHVRYRALLDKALIMLDATLAAADKIGEKTAWIDRARAAKTSMEKDLAVEKATIAKFPFTEEELEKALVIMQAKAAKASR
jgi:tetratricopeptide (TPR) repeat protein